MTVAVGTSTYRETPLEASFETHAVISKNQIPRRRVTDIENEFIVRNVLLRNLQIIGAGIKDNIGRQVVIGHPRVHRAD